MKPVGLVLAAVLCSSCAGAEEIVVNGRCASPGTSLDAMILAVGATARFTPPCAPLASAHIDSPIELTAERTGLHVRFSVADRSFHAGTFRQLSGERDVVVVFPSGESPGRPIVELSLIPIAGGYRVEDTLPWDTWGLVGPEGEFRWVCAVLERDSDGIERETRVVLRVRIRRS